tara:strand:- start:208 stop:1599 length:1392 start_codon:yes stop_codon:yes gene_type:complete
MSMSRVVPTKISQYKALPIGVSNKNLEISYTSIIPANSSSGTAFKPETTSRILFRVPAYQNCFLDNARSCLSFTFTVDSDAADASGSGNILNPKQGTQALFKRMIIKSANGLVIEDITDLDVLNKILDTFSSTTESRHMEGIYDGSIHTDNNLTGGNKTEFNTRQKAGVKMLYFFKHGMLSRDLQSYLPLHSMNGGNQGHAFSIELFMNDNTSVLERLATAGTAASIKSYSISDVRYNMTLLKADSSIIDRFNNLSNDSSEIVIPFSTYRSYTNGLNAQKSTVQISEACSDLRKVHTVILSSTYETNPIALSSTTEPSQLVFHGGNQSADANTKVKSYQLQVGSKFIYNEPIVSETDNMEMLNQLLNASFSKSDIKATRYNGNVLQYENADFNMTTTFCYDDPSRYTNGISLGSLPLQLKLETAGVASGDKYLLTFSELGYNLVIKDGYLSVKDSKDISDFGY